MGQKVRSQIITYMNEWHGGSWFIKVADNKRVADDALCYATGSIEAEPGRLNRWEDEVGRMIDDGVLMYTIDASGQVTLELT